MLPKKVLKAIMKRDIELEFKNSEILRKNLAEARNNIKKSLKSEDIFSAKLNKILDEYLEGLAEKATSEVDIQGTIDHGVSQGKKVLTETIDIPMGDSFQDWMPVLPINAISLERAKMADKIKEVADDLKDKILRKAQIGLAQGATTQQVMDEILGTGLRGLKGRDGVFRSATHRAETIGRSITNEIINKGALQTYSQVSEKSPELGLRKVWQAVSDHRTSEICSNLDNQVVDMGDKFPGGFETPPAHPNCRSRITVLPKKKWDQNEQKGKYPPSENLR